MIEVVLNVVEDKKEKYPYLGIHGNGVLVLFSSTRQGIQINKSLYREAGYFSKEWIEEEFKPLQGSITLSNA